MRYPTTAVTAPGLAAVRTNTGKWRIETLLATGVQVFDNLTDEDLATLGGDLDARDLTVPVVVSADGILVDGHQRLLALHRRGVKYLTADQVRVSERITATNALEESVKLNVRRRHLTIADKAVVARRLIRERGFSQARVAELFGVSRPAVSQWLAAVADDNPDTEPVEVLGLDGKVRTVTPPKGSTPKAPDLDDALRRMWVGPVARMPKKLTDVVKDLAAFPPSRAVRMLPRADLAVLERQLQDVLEAAESALAELQTARAAEAARADDIE